MMRINLAVQTEWTRSDPTAGPMLAHPDRSLALAQVAR
jgi:hypothetical protein